MDISQSIFLYGFLAWFACHTVFGYCVKNCLAYGYELLEEEPMQRALRGYLVKAIVSGVLFVGLTLCFILVKAWAKNFILLMVATMIGVCTSFISFEERAKEYYKRQSEKYKPIPREWNGLDGKVLLLYAVILGSWVALTFLAVCIRFVW